MLAVADKSVIEVRGLDVRFWGRGGPIPAVRGVSYAIGPKRTLGVVGESGCGKSVTALAVMGLIDPPGQVSGEAILLEGTDLLALSDAGMDSVRGARVSMIFQEPMTALNPVFTVGDQIAEAFTTHRALGHRQARAAAVDMLDRVGIAAPAARFDDYPHQMSGGMRQRVMIAMALACRPALLIADEPTTALDVTVQAQILELMLEIQESFGMAIHFISHDLGVISEIADDIAVMYAGRIVERAPAARIFEAPAHPYTQGLLETVPRIGGRRDALPAIPGNVPDPASLPSGCAFRDRCARATTHCAEVPPVLELVASDHWAACVRIGL